MRSISRVNYPNQSNFGFGIAGVYKRGFEGCGPVNDSNHYHGRWSKRPHYESRLYATYSFNSSVRYVPFSTFFNCVYTSPYPYNDYFANFRKNPVYSANE